MEKLCIALLIIFSFSFISLHRPNLDAPREIHIKTPGLMYDQVRFKVDPGEVIKITLENTDEMSHNMVIAMPGAREKVVALAAELIHKQEQNNFVPDTELVLNYIPILKPREKKSMLFKAPEKEGVYPYVCTYPGHGTIMYGAIYVTDGELPDIKKDNNIPPKDRQAALEHAHHSAKNNLPAIYRTFMPDCGPAGIAVGMVGNVSYCWDAGECRLRYAWKGGFLSLKENWGSNGNKKAVIEGTVFYREKTVHPIRIGTKDYIPEPEFKGYSMINGYPTFRYKLDKVEVLERITPMEKQQGFKREFTFSNVKKPLWFLRSDLNREKINTTQGEWEGNYFKIKSDGDKARFVLTVKNEE